MYDQIVEDLSRDKSSLVLVSEFEAFSAVELFDYFVRPELVVQWWPREATTDAGRRWNG